jgi:aminoglycoside/choline kinase family phosphotransferase
MDWHPRLLAGLLDAAARQQFHAEFSTLQADLRNATRLFAHRAVVEDLTRMQTS